MKRVLFIVGDCVEDYEVMVPFQVLDMFGFKVDVICPGKKYGEYIRTVIHDDVGAQTYGEAAGHRFCLTATFSLVDGDDHAGLYLPGGRAPEYLRLNADVLALTRGFMEAGLPVAAICHGPQILAAADVLRGRRLTAHPTVGPEVTLAGGRFVPMAPAECVTDGNLVTAPAWPGHPGMMRAFLRLLDVSALT